MVGLWPRSSQHPGDPKFFFERVANDKFEGGVSGTRMEKATIRGWKHCKGVEGWRGTACPIFLSLEIRGCIKGRGRERRTREREREKLLWNDFNEFHETPFGFLKKSLLRRGVRGGGAPLLATPRFSAVNFRVNTSAVKKPRRATNGNKRSRRNNDIPGSGRPRNRDTLG